MLMLNGAGNVNVPQQLVIKKDASSIPLRVAKERLNLPLGTLIDLIILVSATSLRDTIKS